MSAANNPGIDLDLMAAAAQTRLAAQTPTTAAYPWDDITALDDVDDMTTFDLVGIALQVATVVAFIFCTGFGLGYLTGAR